jgi:hypothetical protein
MTENPGQWGPQGGYPPQGQPTPGGYPPQQPGGYPPQQQPGGYPPQQQPGGYPPQQGGYNPQGAYNPQAGYAPQATFPPQGAPGGFPPQGPAGPPPQGAPPAKKKSPFLLIGIVVAAVLLLAAIGGIILVLNRGDKTPGSTITPTSQPTTQPTGQPTEQPTGQSTEPTEQPTSQPSGQSIDLGGGISLTPADGYQTEKTGEGFARLSNGKQLFVGQAGKLDPSTNPGQFCDAFHHKVTEGNANPRFAEPKTVSINPKVKAATCQAVSTVSAGSGSGEVYVFSLVSVRTDGLTIIGTIFFTKTADTNQLNKDFSFMVNSMLTGQIAGG